jgi:hypothetical protein
MIVQIAKRKRNEGNITKSNQKQKDSNFWKYNELYQKWLKLAPEIESVRPKMYQIPCKANMDIINPPRSLPVLQTPYPGFQIIGCH